MSLRPESIESVPKQTVRVARTAFPKESREMGPVPVDNG